MSGASRARRLLPKALLALLGLTLAGVFLALWSGPADAAATFTVNRTDDAGDLNINDDVCDTSGKTGEQCTLRAAIEEANGNGNPAETDTINFGISGKRPKVKTIKPARPLPTITEPVTIDGYTQRGARANTLDLEDGNDAKLRVQLNGTNAGAGSSVNGLTIRASGSTIRGLVINRFEGNGIDVQSSSGGNPNRIEGNFTGTNASGTVDLGNGNNGVRISADNNLVGDRFSNGARNIISSNDDDGVEIGSANENVVEGNFIGTNAKGTTALGNTVSGVSIFNAPANTIGDTTASAGNLIAHNDQDGVLISGSAVGNSVLSNSIFSNGELGIDLGTDGVTANEPDDPDAGANNLQNFPVITEATRPSTGPTIISGRLDSNPNQSFTIQCFMVVPDPSGHGEGQISAGQDTTVTTNANGAGSFTCSSFEPEPGQRVTATATNNATGDTSEFSLNADVQSGP
jgi:hypothetical protein